ncbi:MAG: hypothetical protein WC453_02560 [Patescibacteria group bacterium]
MSKGENLNKDIDLKNYEDLSGVSLREMNFGLWLSENRQKFLKIFTVLLILLCVFFFVLSSYNLFIYFMSDDPNAQISAAVPTSPRQLTDDLRIAPLQVFVNGDKADLAVKIANPNDKFMATFKYCFTAAGNDLACGQEFILPAAEKYILALGQSAISSQNGANFSVSDIFWQRINAHQIPDWNAFFTERLNFSIGETAFSAGTKNQLSDKISLNHLSFAIQNQTAYSYYEVPLNILLFSGSELVGVNRYVLENFSAGARREVRMSWAGDLAGVNMTEIVPDLNIMDNQVYWKYQGGATN